MRYGSFARNNSFVIMSVSPQEVGGWAGSPVCLQTGEARARAGRHCLVISVTKQVLCLNSSLRQIVLQSGSCDLCGDIHRKSPTITPMSETRQRPDPAPGSCALRGSCVVRGPIRVPYDPNYPRSCPMSETSERSRPAQEGGSAIRMMVNRQTVVSHACKSAGGSVESRHGNERGSMARSDGGEVPQVHRGDRDDPKPLADSDDRRIGATQSEVGVLAHEA